MKVFGVEFTPELLFKLIVLAFVAGGLYYQLDDIRTAVRDIPSLNQRVSKIEGFLETSGYRTDN